MKTGRKLPGIIGGLALGAALLLLPASVHEARATQSLQETTVTLTTGAWHPDGAEPDHVDVFKVDGNFTYGSLNPDGTFTEIPGYGGMWILTGSGVELTYWQWPTRKDVYAFPILPDGTHGQDENGKAISMTRRSLDPSARNSLSHGMGKAAEASVPADLQREATETVKKYRDSIVFVTGSDGAGSAFVARDGTSSYLVTNVHVAAGILDAGFMALDGRDVHGGTPSMAVGEDLFRMEFPKGDARRFPIMQDVDSNVSIGDAVVVLGNAEGAGVVNTLIGKVVGIGPDLVEVDAPFVPGNSGSPIIQLKTGKVIGVAAFAQFAGFEGFGFGMFDRVKVRRFGYRLDSVKAWQPVEWQAFRSQAREMEAIDKRTGELIEGLEQLFWSNGRLTKELASDAGVKSAWQEYQTRQKQRGKKNQKRLAANALIAALKAACESDVTAAAGQITYDYFKRELDEQKKARGEIEDQIATAVNGGG